MVVSWENILRWFISTLYLSVLAFLTFNSIYTGILVNRRPSKLGREYHNSLYPIRLKYIFFRTNLIWMLLSK